MNLFWVLVSSTLALSLFFPHFLLMYFDGILRSDKPSHSHQSLKNLKTYASTQTDHCRLVPAFYPGGPKTSHSLTIYREPNKQLFGPLVWSQSVLFGQEFEHLLWILSFKVKFKFVVMFGSECDSMPLSLRCPPMYPWTLGQYTFSVLVT